MVGKNAILNAPLNNKIQIGAKSKALRKHNNNPRIGPPTPRQQRLKPPHNPNTRTKSHDAGLRSAQNRSTPNIFAASSIGTPGRQRRAKTPTTPRMRRSHTPDMPLIGTGRDRGRQRSRSRHKSKEGLRTPGNERRAEFQHNSLAGSKTNRQYIPYRPSTGYNQPRVSNKSYDVDARGWVKPPSTPLTPDRKARLNSGLHNHSVVRHNRDRSKSRELEKARSREIERLLKRERQTQRDKFFNEIDAYKRLNRMSKDDKSLLDFDIFNNIRGRATTGGGKDFDDTKSMKSVMSVRSVASAYSSATLAEMRALSRSNAELDVVIYGKDRGKKKKFAVVKKIPKYVVGALFMPVSLCRRSRPKNTVDPDMRSVVTRHLDEIEKLSDLETTYSRRNSQKSTSDARSSTGRPKIRQKNIASTKYSTMELQKCQSNNLTNKLSNSNSTSSDYVSGSEFGGPSSAASNSKLPSSSGEDREGQNNHLSTHKLLEKERKNNKIAGDKIKELERQMSMLKRQLGTGTKGILKTGSNSMSSAKSSLKKTGSSFKNSVKRTARLKDSDGEDRKSITSGYSTETDSPTEFDVQEAL